MRLGDYAKKSADFDKEGGGDKEKPKNLGRPTQVVCVWARDGGKQPPNPRFPDSAPARRYVFLFEIDEADSRGRRFTVNVNVPVRFGGNTKFGTMLWALGLDKDGDNFHPEAELPGAAIGLSCLGTVDVNDRGYPTFDEDEGKGISLTPLMKGQAPMTADKRYEQHEVPPHCQRLMEILWDKALDMDRHGVPVKEHAEDFAAPKRGADDNETHYDSDGNPLPF